MHLVRFRSCVCDIVRYLFYSWIYIGFVQSNTKILFYFSILDDFHFSLSDSADVSLFKV